MNAVAIKFSLIMVKCNACLHTIVHLDQMKKMMPTAQCVICTFQTWGYEVSQETARVERNNSQTIFSNDSLFAKVILNIDNFE